ncbi:carboxymuconolactone decarboxylase family protein [Blastopirellula sp. JC732]|uniref:Carboxymuconolactone decarboxylase family protein n=1 Tax=Blastopirellula sediminis TaxID=2894196 RepID=A0A9X1MQM4_9BACT|nr:carboxymuconolactone decarboxylase family protein [Blastopirellula sediminis]MCC9606126.1 carboxymuconolactone decarboxylase family protein [Blastopirellula sediminis]MCC9630575.1 carboxymuconolactone decarboxylase family protein [Blastopirellula sediminis]
MSRLQTIAPESVEGKTKEMLDAVEKKLGMTPNLMRTMANSPAVLEGYLALSGALGHGKLPAKIRERISLFVAESNGCDYCLAAHSALGKMSGLTGDQIADSRRGESDDAKTGSLLRFARRIMETRGKVSDAEVKAIRDAGYDDGAIAEIVAGVALNIFTNYFNNVAETEVDFPAAAALQVA